MKKATITVKGASTKQWADLMLLQIQDLKIILKRNYPQMYPCQVPDPSFKYHPDFIMSSSTHLCVDNSSLN